jgi:hypothetical protein
VSRGEQTHVARVVRRDDSTAEPDRGGDYERIDRQLAPHVRVGEEVARNPSHADTRRHDLREAPSEDTIDDLVSSSASVQLDEHRGRNSNREVPPVCTPHCRPDPLVTVRVLSGTSKGGDSLAVKN